MALTFKIYASAGNIWTARLSDNGQLIDLPTMSSYINSHSHNTDNIFLETITESRGNMPVVTYSGHSSCTPMSAVNNLGAGGTFDNALAISNRSHGHGNTSVAANGTSTSTARTPKTDDQVFIESDGTITCDLICTAAGASCLCPYVMYGLYDDHTHTLGGAFTDYTYPTGIQVADDDTTSKKWFHIATDSSGTGAVWDEAITNPGTHGHGLGTLSLAAYAAPAESTGSRAGSPRFRVDHTTGYVYVKNDVNGVGLEAFYDDLYSHLHSGSGVSGSYGPIYAQLFSKAYGGSYQWFEVTSGVYAQLSVEAPAHTHTLGMS